MFGMEKKTRKLFEFDTEKELRKDDKKRKEFFEHIEKQSNELKAALREGKASENYEQCGILLQGYAALSKVMERACCKS
jgi:hypothetical protein